MELTSHSWLRNAGGVAGRPATARRAPSRLSRAVVLGALAAAATTSLASAASTGPTSAAPAAAGQLTQVVVRASAGHLQQAEATARRLGATLGRELRLIDAVAASVPANRLAALRAAPGVAEVSADTSVTLEGASYYDPSGDQNSLLALQQIVGTRALWNQWTGAGVDVALIDSGVAPVAGLADPGKIVNGPDLTPEAQNPATAHLDTYGHGTHMAGIIAGHDSGVTPAGNTNPTTFLGVAPDARIVNVKAADVHGVSDVSQVIAGIDWVVQHAHDNGMNIRVLNLSFGTDSSQPYTLDPLAYAAEQAWKHGIVTVVAAGNTGARSGRLTDPAIDPFVIAVGADDTNGTLTTADDSVAAFSSRGDETRGPDLVAPGAHVQSLRVPGSYIDGMYGATGRLGDRYFRGSGTSQAAAFVSGSAAQLVQEHPGYTPDQIKALLVGTASRLPAADPLAQGAGLINMSAASGPFDVTGKVQSFVASIGAGTLEAARGSRHLVLTDRTTGQSTQLTGETDVHGAPVSTGSLAATEQNGRGWSDGVSAPTRGGDDSGGSAPESSSWASSSWASAHFASGTWTAAGWSNANWTSSSWASSSWASSSWAASSWPSSSWASSSWASSSWASSSWADASWQSSSWG
ncbi:MAG TPA: S8 family serine peptidase [Mycobacteriales bacterium]|nr:S8 family serine peptidase [Mycobacteriales bacterium]